MKLKTLLGCAFLAATINTALAANCLPVYLTSVSQNYFPIYYQSPSTLQQIFSPTITVTASYAYQPVGPGGATEFCMEFGLVGTVPDLFSFAGGNVWGWMQSTSPYPGTITLRLTVDDFTKLTAGKFHMWSDWEPSNGATDIYSSNSLDFWVDEPAYMLVITDNTYSPAPPKYPNEWREVLYEVHNTSGSLAPQINIGENISYTQSSPPCSLPQVVVPTSCTDVVPGITNTYGKFYDIWAIRAITSPAGCGISNIVDHWQACSPNVYDSYNHARLPVKPFGTLTGYTHTNSIDILGAVAPPQTNHMPTGKKILP